MNYVWLWLSAVALAALFWGAIPDVAKAGVTALLLACAGLLAYPLVQEHLTPDQRAEIAMRQALQDKIDAEIKRLGTSK